ncbi:MAG: ABC transporter ATP-binding protein [Candidatus Woesearchaeota archaeon]
MLDIKNLHVSAGSVEILKGLSLSIEDSSVYVLFGPNGSGKTTLMKALVGFPNFEVKGSIKFEGKDITEKSIDERARLGLNISFQDPPAVKGVTLHNMLNICLKRQPEEELPDDALDMAKRFGLSHLLERDINADFSGGERKRADILQLIMLKPKLLLLDEPDSGVDVESLKVISREIARYVRENKASALVITHHGQVLDYLTSKTACVLLEGQIRCYQDPVNILEEIKKKGYVECVNCHEKWKN